MKSFSTSAALKAGWQVFEKNRWFVIRLSLIGFGFSIVSNYISQTSNEVSGLVISVLVFTSIALSIISTLLHIGFFKFGLKLLDGERPKMKELLSNTNLFWKFLGGAILYGITVGLVFLVSLAIIIFLSLVFQSKFILAIIVLAAFLAVVMAMQYFFTLPFVIDQNLGPIEAMKKSADITKGIRIDLFAFTVMVIVLNILGAICLGIGLLISVPVSFFAYLYIYRSLTKGPPSPISRPIASTPSPIQSQNVPVHILQ